MEQQNNFTEILNKIAKSRTLIPSEALVSILSGIVVTSEKNNPNVLTMAEALKDAPTNEVISKAVLVTCNSVLMSLYNAFKNQIDVAYEKNNKPDENTDKIDA